MTGELKLFLRSKDAHVNTMVAFDLRLTRQDESGLRQICLSSQRLHIFGRKAACIRKNCELVALKWAFGKDIDLCKVKGGMGGRRSFRGLCG